MSRFYNTIFLRICPDTRGADMIESPPTYENGKAVRRPSAASLRLPGLDPKRVKYAMAWPNAWATLFNAEGFPAWGFEAEVK